MTIIAVDPGIDKCGLILVDLHKNLVIDGRVVSKSSVLELIHLWKRSYLVTKIFIGNGTSSGYWESLIRKLGDIEIIDEKGSTLLARKRYWELWPPSFWIRLIPEGLLVPPVSLDAVAALVFLEKYLNKKIKWYGPVNFKTWPLQ